jgi:hypothetical protein
MAITVAGLSIDVTLDIVLRQSCQFDAGATGQETKVQEVIRGSAFIVDPPFAG